VEKREVRRDGIVRKRSVLNGEKARRGLLCRRLDVRVKRHRPGVEVAVGYGFEGSIEFIVELKRK
jgi:hypothetical protein